MQWLANHSTIFNPFLLLPVQPESVFHLNCIAFNSTEVRQCRHISEIISPHLQLSAR